MNQVNPAHEEAMRLAQEALSARQAGLEQVAIASYRKALEYEQRAVASYLAEDTREPTRSVLLRSAASLALACSEPREAERLAARALAGDPPAEVARELREIAAAAYSLLETSLCGRRAEDLAAVHLLRGIDDAALAVVWVSHLVNRWSRLVADPASVASSISNLEFLRSFLAARLAAPGAWRGFSVQGVEAFWDAVGQVEEALAFAARAFVRSDTLLAGPTGATVMQEARSGLAAGWRQLRRRTRELHEILFPDDWLPDAGTASRPAWPVSIPEGRRLGRLCADLRRVQVARRVVVRRAMVTAGMSAQGVHEFDTLTELFLWQPDPDSQLRPLRSVSSRTPGTIDEAFAEKIATAEIQLGWRAAEPRQREQYLQVAAACPSVQARPESFENAVHLAAAYGKFAAENLPESELAARIVWRICDRILAECGAAMEPSNRAFHAILDTARKSPLQTLVSLLDIEFQVARGYSRARQRTPPGPVGEGSHRLE